MAVRETESCSASGKHERTRKEDYEQGKAFGHTNTSQQTSQFLYSCYGRKLHVMKLWVSYIRYDARMSEIVWLTSESPGRRLIDN